MAKENNNKSFVLRIDAATMEALEGWAADEFRSINGQLQWIIADALRRSGRLKKPRAAAGATLPAADTGVASSGRDFPPAPAAVSHAVAAAPPADVASGESTPPLQDAVPPVAAAAAGEAGPLPPHARMLSGDPQKKKADTYREKQEPVHSPCTDFSSILFILYCPSSLTALIGVL